MLDKHENIGRRDLLRKIQTYRHDRMRAFTRRHAEPVERALPTLDQAIAAGRHEHFAQEKPVKLALRFAATEDGERLCGSFRDAPLGAGQAISANAAGGHDLHTEVRDSLQLRWLLQRYADRVQVLAPPALVQHLRDFVKAAAAMQGG